MSLSVYFKTATFRARNEAPREDTSMESETRLFQNNDTVYMHPTGMYCKYRNAYVFLQTLYNAYAS